MRGFFIIRSVTRYRRYPGTQPLIIRVLRTQSSERPEGVFVAVLCTNRVVYYSTGNATILFNHINTISNMHILVSRLIIITQRTAISISASVIRRTSHGCAKRSITNTCRRQETSNCMPHVCSHGEGRAQLLATATHNDLVGARVRLAR